MKDIKSIVKPCFLGSAFFFAGVIDCSKGFTPYSAFFSGWSTRGLCTGVIVTCVFLLVSTYRTKLKPSKRWQGVNGYLALWFNTFLICASSIILFMQSEGSPFFDFTFGAVSGIGTVGITVSWIAAYAHLHDLERLACGCLSLAVVAVLICVATVLGIPQIVLAVFGSLLSAISLTSLYRSYSTNIFKSNCADNYQKPLLQDIKNIVTITWIPLLGAALVALIFGLTYDDEASGTVKPSIIYSLMALIIALIVIASLALYASNKKKLYSTMCTILLPIVTTIILISPALSFDNSIVSALLGIAQPTCFIIMLIIALYSMVAASHTLSTPLLTVCAFYFIMLSGSALVGTILIHPLGQNGRNLCFVLLAAYLVAVILWHAQEAERAKDNHPQETSSPEQFIRQRCKDFETEYGVSPRESEVLFYLGRGYSPVYIANMLSVSESTVRTHVRHIYSKLGVTSKEELLGLIDGVQPTQPTRHT